MTPSVPAPVGRMRPAFALSTLLLVPTLALAQYQVVGDDACPKYAVDIAAFATCEGDRVVRPQQETLRIAAVPADEVPPLKQTDAGLYVTAAEADRLKNSHADQVVLIDIRSRVEVLYAGRPEDVDIHVPYREPALSPRWSASGDRLVMQRNPAFVSEVRAALARLGRPDDSTILLLCRSGTVSAIAADALTAAGLRNVFTIVDGFEGDLAASGRRDVNGWKNVSAHWTSGTADALSLAAPR